MNKNLKLVSILLIVFASEAGFSKTSTDKTKENRTRTSTGKASSRENRMRSQLGTSFRFDGSSLHGKYQTSPGTTAMVEDDKWIDDLLGARTSFNDRIEQDRKRN